MKRPITGMRVRDIQEALVAFGVPEKKARYHSLQIFKWIYQRFVVSFDEMTDLSKVVRGFLHDNYTLTPIPRVFEQVSTDGTRKFLFELSDGKTVESVLIPTDDRLTICISSQVGCAMGCKFCNTASMGLERNLEVYEIVGQVLELSRAIARGDFLIAAAGGQPLSRISNIVYMGMGEPLHNVENVACSVEVLLQQEGLNFSKRKVTISTSGLVPAIRKLNERLTLENKVNLAISLNGSYDAQRESIMPVNKAFNIEALMQACREWHLEPHRRITFEYVLLGELNDSIEDAERVALLVKDIPSKLNVIPYNPHPSSEYKRPTDERLDQFHAHLLLRNVAAMIRHSRGRDILAACGQLKSRVEELMPA